MKLKIVADKNMPMVETYFSNMGSVFRVDGRTLQPEQIIDADILLVRSVTKVNRSLLDNSSVKFVGTATIGTDHIDLQYLKQNNIGFASAPGCNADSVAEYILSALIATNRLNGLIEKNKKLAIVGVGNVGSRVARIAQKLGFDFLCYDPPKQRIESETQRYSQNWCNWQQVLNADVISLHVPYTDTGLNPTHHMFTAKELSKLKPECLIINSSRGAVIDNKGLAEYLANHNHQQNIQVVLDVWENEPNILLPLRDLCSIHTPHVAGYSKDGKIKGTEMIYQAALQFFNPEDESMLSQKSVGTDETIEVQWNDSSSFLDNLKQCVFASYNINSDSNSLKPLNASNIAKTFDLLRQNYPDRLEFKHYLIEAVPRRYQDLIQSLGFQIASPI